MFHLFSRLPKNFTVFLQNLISFPNIRNFILKENLENDKAFKKKIYLCSNIYIFQRIFLKINRIRSQLCFLILSDILTFSKNFKKKPCFSMKKILDIVEKSQFRAIYQLYQQSIMMWTSAL